MDYLDELLTGHRRKRLICEDCPAHKLITKDEQEREKLEILKKSHSFFAQFIMNLNIADRRLMNRVKLRLKYLQLVIIQEEKGYFTTVDVMHCFRLGSFSKGGRAPYSLALRKRKLLKSLHLCYRVGRSAFRLNHEAKLLISRI